MKRLIGYLMLLLIGTGCSGQVTASSDEIISNVLASNKDIGSVYSEGEMLLYIDDELTEQVTFEEYVSSEGQRKIITSDAITNQQSMAVNDGETMVIYEQGSDTAHSIDVAGLDLPTSFTQKEQVTAMIENMKDTHSFEIKGEEEVLGFDTYHLLLKANAPSSIIGDMELWVDQKTWFVIKSKTISGETRSEMQYEYIDFSPTFPVDTFTLDLPDSVTIQPLEGGNQAQQGTIAEAEEALETPFYVVDQENVSIREIEVYSFGGEVNRNEVTIYYSIDDDPAFLLSVFPTPEGPGMSLGNSGEESVRGHAIEYMEEIRSIMWDEDGLRYSIIIENPDVSFEKALEAANQMTLSSEE
ncbi:LolA family protein [Halalkalibacter okhensis]|uniref:MucB/RseB N-terminal domain-containing protein n=1 Tax=Halalkalibacter okhensis TaxID=333138 RepID=A0A0B0IEY7_9BACI|nr:hypothetical protein [Halalkalibacter okhensis]KHF41158.1 hypothetical protein LQ50_05190 [Halalkalibacter okhensis]